MDFKLKKSNLNLKVYSAAKLPSTGNENDTVIISSTPMKNWILSPDKPNGAPRTDGDVWIKYSVRGNTRNVLKTDSMMIAMISAYQYVDGAWRDVEAKSWQNGAWADWVKWIYNNGDEYTDITGGWEAGGTWKWTSTSSTGINEGASKTDAYIRLNNNNTGSTTVAVCGTLQPIDLTNVTSVVFVVDVVVPTVKYTHYVVSKSKTVADANVVVQNEENPGVGTGVLIPVNVSTLSGAYYIGAGQTYQGDIRIKGVYLV